MTRILVHRAGALGDVLNTTPVLRRLRFENMDAEIVVSTQHGAVYLDNPHVNAVRPGELLRMMEYDRLVNLDGVYEANRKCHQVDAFMLAAFGDGDGDKTLALTRATALPEICDGIDWPRTVVVHPNTSWPSRTLPYAWWQDVVDRIALAGYQVVVTGTNIDVMLARAADLRGRLSLAQQATMIDRCAAVLCGPSGVVNVAGTTDTPIVTLGTITDLRYVLPYRHGELGWNCVPVRTPMYCYGCYDDAPPATYYNCRRGDNACVVSFSPETVVESVIFAIENDRRK